MKRAAAFGLALSLAVSAACATEARADDHFYIVGGELHSGNGDVVRDAVIEVRDGRIVTVAGPDARPGIPPAARTIDATGKWVTPGLIAANTNLGLVEIGAVESGRATTRREDGPIRASYDPAPAIRADSSDYAIQAIAGVTTAAVHPTGGLISGQVAWVDLVYGDLSGTVVRRRVAVSGALNRVVGESRAAALGLLGRVFADTKFLRRNRARYERREILRELAAHPRELEALEAVLTGDVPLVVHANGAGDILALIELTQEFGIRLAIAGGAEGWRVAPQLAAAGVPVLLTPRANLPRAFDSVGARLDNAARLARAGVNLAIVIDNAHNLRNLTQEAGIAVAYGLDWEAALTALTLGVARIYGMEATYGSVEPGKVANLVIWSGDPFELSHTAERVWIRGQEIPRVSRQTLLRDRYRQRRGR